MCAGQSTAAWEESHFHRTIRISSKLSHFTITKSNHQPNTAKSTTKPCHRTTERTEERGRDLKGHKSPTPKAQHPHISEVPPGMAISPVHTVPQCLTTFHKWILPNISSKPPWYNCRPFLCVPPLVAKQTNSPHAAALFQAVTESNVCLQTPPVKFSSLCHLSCHFTVPSPALPLFTECIASTQYLCCREGPTTSFCNTDIQPLSYPFSTSTFILQCIRASWVAHVSNL